MPLHAAEKDQAVTDAFRKHRVDRYQRYAARQLINAAAQVSTLMMLFKMHANLFAITYRVLTRGSDHFLRLMTGSRTVLVWTDIVQYPRLTSTDALGGLPGFITFVSLHIYSYPLGPAHVFRRTERRHRCELPGSIAIFAPLTRETCRKRDSP